jgi:hypothetical protein
LVESGGLGERPASIESLSMEWKQAGVKTVDALIEIAVGSSFRLEQIPRIGKKSVLELSPSEFVITDGETRRQYPWSDIGYIGFPPTRKYINGNPNNRFIFLYLREGASAESTTRNSALKRLIYALDDKRTIGDVVVPNAIHTIFGNNCYGGFEQEQLLTLLQVVHSARTGYPYTRQDASFAIYKNKSEGGKPLGLRIEPVLMDSTMDVLTKLQGDESHRRSAAAQLLRALLVREPAT